MTILVVLVRNFVAVKLTLSGMDAATLQHRLEQGVELPTAYLALNLAFSAASALAGGYVAGRVANRRGAKAVRVLAAPTVARSQRGLSTASTGGTVESQLQ